MKIDRIIFTISCLVFLCCMATCSNLDSQVNTEQNATQNNDNTGEFASSDSPNDEESSDSKTPWDNDEQNQGFNKMHPLLNFASGIVRVITFIVIAFFSWLLTYMLFKSSLRKNIHPRTAYWFNTFLFVFFLWVGFFFMFGDIFTNGTVTMETFFEKMWGVIVIFSVGALVITVLMVNSRRR